MFEYVETKRHTVESVYGRPEAEILAKIDAKHEAVEFRYPTSSDVYLSPKDHTTYQSWGCADCPRLILRRKTVKRRVLTETGEMRQAEYGEWYDTGDRLVRRTNSSETASEYPIYRETFVEVEL